MRHAPDEEGECNMLDFDLKDFNYEDMENLKLDDEVEVWTTGQDDSKQPPTSDDDGISPMVLERTKEIISKWINPKPQLFALDDDEEDKAEHEALVKHFESLDECLDKSRKKECCTITDIIRGRPKKKVKKQHLKPVAFLRFNTRKGKPKPISIKVLLLDSGASDSVILAKHVRKLRQKKLKETSAGPLLEESSLLQV